MARYITLREDKKQATQKKKDYCEYFMSSSITPTDLPAAWLIALKQVNCDINKHTPKQLYQSPQVLPSHQPTHCSIHGCCKCCIEKQRQK